MESQAFNPSGVGMKNGRFIGLPYSKDKAKIVVVSVPWDVTVSYRDGTSLAPQKILEESLQLDLYVPEIKDAWQLGIFVQPPHKKWLALNNKIRPLAKTYIHALEEDVSDDPKLNDHLDQINGACKQIFKEVYEETKHIIDQGKIAAVLGGDHSCALGLLKACNEKYNAFGVLQIDAHMDLRQAYENFEYAHASVYFNAIERRYVSKLVQVGIRDTCEEEVIFAKVHRVDVHYDHALRSALFKGETWDAQCNKIIASLPDKVYVSFDIDGLKPDLCPSTGTPVPGGLEYNEAIYLLKKIVESGRQIIAFDLCEVGSQTEWDANVGARVLYNLCNWTGKSQGLI